MQSRKVHRVSMERQVNGDRQFVAGALVSESSPRCFWQHALRTFIAKALHPPISKERCSLATRAGSAVPVTARRGMNGVIGPKGRRRPIACPLIFTPTHLNLTQNRSVNCRLQL